jgi:hypothetical protein
MSFSLINEVIVMLPPVAAPVAKSSFPTLKLPPNFNPQTRYGKPTSNAERSMNGTICLFENRTNQIRRLYLVISPTGNVSLHQIVMLNMHTPRSTYSNRMYQPIALSHTMDSGSYVSQQNGKPSIFFEDSNYQIMSRFLSLDSVTKQHSAYNALIIDAAIAEDYIPVSSTNWDSVEDNKHTMIAYAGLLKLLERTGITAEMKARSLAEIFKRYNDSEQALIEAGKLVSSHILIARPSGIQPIIGLAQNSSSASADFNAEKILSNENSQATFAPIINKFHGFVLPNPSISQDPLTDATFGYGPITSRQTQRTPAMSAEQSAASVLTGDIDSVSSSETSTTGRQRFTAMCQAYDFLNRSLKRDIIISMEDAFNNNLRGQIMSNYIQKNSGLILIVNASLSLIYHKDAQGMRINACTFVFGGNFSYQGHNDPNRPNSTVDIVPNFAETVPIEAVSDTSIDNLGEQFLDMLNLDTTDSDTTESAVTNSAKPDVEVVVDSLEDDVNQRM